MRDAIYRNAGNRRMMDENIYLFCAGSHHAPVRRTP